MTVKVTSLLVLSLLTACTTVPPLTNLNGKPIQFSQPILGKSELQNAKFVLIEKGISDGRYSLVNISSSRQVIMNARQERIAFNADLTAFAPDYNDSSFRTYVDSGNYDEKTVITTCTDIPLKTQNYSACNSTFGETFIPTGITKAYVAGRLSAAAMQEWKEPSGNRLRYVSSPRFALEQAGVFQRLSELSSAK